MRKETLEITYDMAKEIISRDLEAMSQKFISIGYHLKLIRDKHLYTQDGYKDIWEFAQSAYGISKSTCSRWISMNDKFSEGGNSPELKEEFRKFGKSQLQEMLYLTDEQIEQAKPEMTAKEIREIRKPEKQTPAPEEITGQMRIQDYPEFLPEEEILPGAQQEETQTEPVAPAQQHISPIERGCITGLNPNGTCACCGNEGTVECCGKCEDKNSCNVSCGWLETEQQEAKEESPQPLLPKMKNNDQRKEWLSNYRSWGIWYKDEHIGATYYRYEFDNGAALIVEEYERVSEYTGKYITPYYHLVGGPKPERKNGIPKWAYNETYNRYQNSETELLEFLKEIQKHG